MLGYCNLFHNLLWCDTICGCYRTLNHGHIGFRLLFSYAPAMAFLIPMPSVCDLAVRCKGCSETIPSPCGTMPDYWIVAECPLCGAKRRYLPNEIFRGRLSWKLMGKKPIRSETGVRPWER
jgi:hypothetical protein